MKKFTLIFFTTLVLSFATQAQDYKTGIGIRSGWGSGLSWKHFLGEQTAFEGILNSQWKGFSLTGLFEIHKNAFNADRLYWYYGGGGHIGFWNGKYNSRFDAGNNTIIGIDGVLGLEYNFDFIPINLSVDWKPALNLVGVSGFWGDGGAVSIRYIF
ncbi:MAG: hypothetical protein WC384_09370 [Prolixibacteraceae bacterium]|jgi:hypothetical protein